MIFCKLLCMALLLGFAYLIYIAANKEKGNLKKIGQGLSWAIIILVLSMIINCSIYGVGSCSMQGGMMGCPSMMKK